VALGGKKYSVTGKLNQTGRTIDHVASGWQPIFSLEKVKKISPNEG